MSAETRARLTMDRLVEAGTEALMMDLNFRLALTLTGLDDDQVAALARSVTVTVVEALGVEYHGIGADVFRVGLWPVYRLLAAEREPAPTAPVTDPRASTGRIEPMQNPYVEPAPTDPFAEWRDHGEPVG